MFRFAFVFLALSALGIACKAQQEVEWLRVKSERDVAALPADASNVLVDQYGHKPTAELVDALVLRFPALKALSIRPFPTDADIDRLLKFADLEELRISCEWLGKEATAKLESLKTLKRIHIWIE